MTTERRKSQDELIARLTALSADESADPGVYKRRDQGLTLHAIQPEYNAVVSKLIKARSALVAYLGGEEIKKTTEDHTLPKRPGTEREDRITECIEDIDVAIKRMFYSRQNKVPLCVAKRNLDDQMQIEMNKAAAVDHKWADIVTFLNANFRENVIESKEDLNQMSSEMVQERKSHFTGSKWTKANMCNMMTYFPGVDRFSSDKIRTILNTVNKWGMEIFELDKITGHRPLVFVAYSTFCQHNLFKTFEIPKDVFVAYFTEIESQYHRSNSYHNNIHAADVMQSVNALLSAEKLQTAFTDLEIMTVLFAAAVHDVDHPGVNNLYMINTQSPLAALYNNESVLENHHLHVAFKTLMKPGNDIFSGLNKRQRYLLRKNTYSIVLGTDMAKHKEMLANLQVNMDSFNSKMMTKDRVAILEVMCHAADLSNPCKPIHIYNEWVDRVMTEFFRQGDLERTRGFKVISMMCDRYKKGLDIPSTQLGFIDFVVNPLYAAWGQFVSPNADKILQTLEENRMMYENGAVHHRQFRSAYEKGGKDMAWFAEKTLDDITDWTDLSLKEALFRDFPIQTTFNKFKAMPLHFQILFGAIVIAGICVCLYVSIKANGIITCLAKGPLI